MTRAGRIGPRHPRDDRAGLPTERRFAGVRGDGVTVYERIYRVVRRIPRGRVATYGQIAELAQASGPRQVGYALHALPARSDVPWHRVVNAQGHISLRSGLGGASFQQALLQAEAVEFDARGRIDFGRFRWKTR